jgi:hypothetical protein
MMRPEQSRSRGDLPPIPVSVSLSLTFLVPQTVDGDKTVDVLFSEIRDMLELYRESGNLRCMPLPVRITGFGVQL